MSRKILVDTDGLYRDGKLWRVLGDRGILFYVRLWGIAEHWGGFDPDLEGLKYDCLALNASEQEIKGYMDKLHRENSIAYYRKDGKIVGLIRAYTRHQKHSHPAKNSLPLPDGITYDGKYSVDYDILESFLDASGILPETLQKDSTE